MAALVPLGRVIATPGALNVLLTAGQDPEEPLDRYQSGDWGEVSPEDAIAHQCGPHPTESDRQRRQDRVERRHPQEMRQPLADLVAMRQTTVGC
jgi:hypothetical protein